MQEIERKFLIEEFPDLPLLEEAEAFQGYLSVEPVVRIRKKVSKEKTSYVLCIKGKGRLCRKEIELSLPKETFDELEELLEIPMVRKEYRVYALGDGPRRTDGLPLCGSGISFGGRGAGVPASGMAVQ